MLLPLPSVEKTIKPNTNTSKTPNNAKQPVVAIPIEQHSTSRHPENHQVTKTRSGLFPNHLNAILVELCN